MQIKLIATDMDDTLLNSQVQVSERNKAAIHKALAAGVHVLLATGRMFLSAQRYAQQLELPDVPLVTYNGALVKASQSGKVYYEKRLKLETAKALLAYCREHGYYVQAYYDQEIITRETCEFSRRYEAVGGTAPRPVGDALYTLTEPPYKMIMMTDPAQLPAIWKDIERRFAGRVDVTTSKVDFIELMEPGVNKWEAVRMCGQVLGVRPAEMMCCGDSENDYEMVKCAGLGVAVANATPRVLQAAKLVTADHDQDGVALAIETILTQQVEVPES